MKSINQMNIQDYVEIAARRKWLIIVPLVIVMVSGALLSRAVPPVYEASTLILIQKQRVPEAYIKPTVTTEIEERLQTLSQQIMSRTRLETIINELSLYPELKNIMFMEEIVEKMRKDISLEVKGKEAFQLFYQGKDPQLVAKVADRLASLYIEENLKMREDLAEGTTEFLDRELLRVKKQLEQQEAALTRFKQGNLGALPEQMDANLRSLDQMQLQLQTVTTSLQNARERRDFLRNQAAQLSSLESQVGGNLYEVETEYVEGASSSPSLAALEERLAELKAKYTDKHPDVIRIKNQIKRLQETEAAEEEDGTSVEMAAADAGSSAGESFSFYDTMSVEIQGVDMEIARLAEEEGRIREKMTAYVDRIEKTPRLEQEMTALERDYDNTKKNYESILEKSLNAQIAANMERVQKGERFKILDPAKVPQKPVKPNRALLFLLSILLGLGLGAGLALGAEYLDHSFRDIDDLEQYTGLPVLATIPTITTEKGLERKTLKERLRARFA